MAPQVLGVARFEKSWAAGVWGNNFKKNRMTAQDIERLRRLLLLLQKEDVDGRVSRKHSLNPTRSEEELNAFEQQHGIRLPEDYRFFLREAGDGGSGPYYGIQSLQAASYGHDLSVPFPFTESTDDTYFDWPRDEPPGVLELCDQGCGYYFWLVVNGPAHGTIWNYWHHDNTWQPVGLTFGAFYTKWMNQMEELALPRLAHEQVVSKVEVGMKKAEVIAICGGQSQMREVIGMRFLQFGHLSTEFLLDDNDEVERIIYHHIFWPLV